MSFQEPATYGQAPHYHAVVWLDHHEARVVHFNRDAADETVVRPPPQPFHIHSKAGSPSGTHLRGEDSFYREVAAALKDNAAILLVGPSTAKHEFLNYLDRHDPRLKDRIDGIETKGPLTDNQLLAEARRFFKAADRMS